MTTLRFETLPMPGADLGAENPLPPLGKHRDIHTADAIPGIPEDMLHNIAYGHVPGILPYTMQDGYTRQRRLRDFQVAVLENRFLRATFLLDYGGRLRSLFHKPTQRELLDVNPVFQPANLALRNAWFSGGVEWNIGTTGHWPMTCAPLFAAEATTPTGEPMLRLYEWERIRQVPFQLDITLPDDSPYLYVYVRIRNLHTETVPMYWWSNIAVPETPETRVLVPAEQAFSFGYGSQRGLRRVSIPVIEGTDISYATQINRAADFFFDVPQNVHPWVTALDGQGKGLVQCSTRRLRGRKLFIWGMGTGGRRWQTFLSEPGHTYLEIQAGLARTQLEHIPMPGESTWSWLEAYGLMEADPTKVHGDDWQIARETVQAQLNVNLPSDILEQRYSQAEAWADLPVEVIAQTGSGWGALEALRLEQNGKTLNTPATPLEPAFISSEQHPWMVLLQEGALPDQPTEESPRSYMVQAEWTAMLEQAIQAHPSWSQWLHLGVMRYYAGDHNAAREAWEASLARAENAWAARNLAFLAWEDGESTRATELYGRSLSLKPDLLPLVIESGQKLLSLDAGSTWLDWLPNTSSAIQENGRVRLIEGWAALQCNDLDRVANLLANPWEVDDLREGERSLSELWYAYHSRRLSLEMGISEDADLRARVQREFPVPAALDFRMS